MNTKGSVTVRAVNAIILIQMLLQLSGGVVIGVIMALVFLVTQQQEMAFGTNEIYGLVIFTQVFAILLPALIYLKYKKVNIKEALRIKPLSFFHVIIITIMALAGQFVAMLLNTPVMMLLELIGEVPPSPFPTPDTVSGLMVAIVIIAVFPAICEEVLVRGVVLRGYERRGTVAAIVISAIFFGIMHGDIKNLIGPIFFGVVFAYIVIRTGSLFAGIVAHFINNAFALLIDYGIINYEQQFGFLNEPAYFFLIAFAAVFVFVAALMIIKNTTQWEPKKSISSKRAHTKVAFLNIPIIVTLFIFFVLQIFVFAEILY